MVKESVEKECKQCGATIVLNCPATEEEFCEKKRSAVCPTCKFVDDDEDDPKCSFPEK